MSEKEKEIEIEIDNEGFCKNCHINHNCLNCDVMNELELYNGSLLKILDKKQDKKEETNKQPPICGDCGYRMKESKFKTGPAYWCPRCRGK